MRIDVLTIFPDMITPVIKESIIGRAIYEEKLTINVIDFREFTLNKHKKVDDYPYGGGAGMVLQVEPVIRALRSIENYENALKIMMTPQGIKYEQKDADKLSKENHLIILCGHYEGFDERIRPYFDLEISIGDYVLTGGEIAALAIIDSTIRLIPGILNKEASHEFDSFSDGLLEYPQYTRPREFEGKAVPEVLLSGNHQQIEAWRKTESLKRTKERREDLYEKYTKPEKSSGK
ncbi:tRNA (guanosine(37)-N1)-methyltransferase TrmD [Liberiplasma polymorphum]|uniref:tRNA (guanosine(37)-N1)-methyltransferase TrmD n=1 Tax=Liberiplasma polymorphum TaxID=3374570 RepID=UPI0037752B5F